MEVLPGRHRGPAAHHHLRSLRLTAGCRRRDPRAGRVPRARHEGAGHVQLRADFMDRFPSYRYLLAPRRTRAPGA
ncbi:hypothetical protein QJS66_20045 [Kocuria rhizophila]|nr:hypothetical protein QJS66_20045 [Kocuria rhizophila]